MDDFFAKVVTKEIPPPADGTCEHCGGTEGLQWEDSRTQYDTTPLEGHWTRFDRILRDIDPPEDPNRPRLLCRPCAEEHHSYWTEMWNEYYRSRL